MAAPKTFSIQGRSLALNSQADIQPHLDELKAVEGVEKIVLSGNTLGVEACQALADAIKDNQTLKVVDLSDIFTGRLLSEIPLCLKALCGALKTIQSLIELNLSDNAIGFTSVDPVTDFLTHHRTLSILKLSNNGMGPEAGKKIAEALSGQKFVAGEGLSEYAKVPSPQGQPQTSSALRTFICGRNRLEIQHYPIAWAVAFQSLPRLLEVRLPQNGIRPNGVTAIVGGQVQGRGEEGGLKVEVAALSNCPNLEVLDLQDNTLTEDGSRAVAHALPKWPKLRELNLSDCLLKRKGGLALGTTFVKGVNPELRVLKLAFGEFDGRTIDLVATAIKDHWPKLTVLELNGNIGDADDDCIQNVTDALEEHGHGDALDELDDMTDPADADEEEDEEHVAVEEAEGLDKEEEEANATSSSLPKAVPPAVKAKLDAAADDLADLLGKVSIGEKPPTLA